jgi:rubrerythrin
LDIVGGGICMTTADWRYLRPDMNMAHMSNQQLQQSIKLIVESVKGEKEDQLFYEFLIKEAPTEEEKEIIASIRDDEIKHNRMFRQLYTELTKKELPSDVVENFTPPASYLDGIKQALFGELRAVEKYRKIRSGLPTRQERDILFEIITDELKHASKYNYLFTLNRTKSANRTTGMEQTIGEITEFTNQGEQSEDMNGQMDSQMNGQNQFDMTEQNQAGMGEQIEMENTQTQESPDQQPNTEEMSLADQWLQYIQPLVESAVKEAEDGGNLTLLFQKYILAGVLVGNQFTHEQAFTQLEQWNRNGEATLLAK